MAKTDNYFQFPIYLLDGDMTQIRGWIIAHSAYLIGRKRLGNDDNITKVIRTGCNELKTVEYSQEILRDYFEADEKLQAMTSKHGTPNQARVREDIFKDAMKPKPSITENQFRVFAAMTAVLGNGKFKSITRNRLHAGASGNKTSELPEGWTERVKFTTVRKVTASLMGKNLFKSCYDTVGRRTTYYSIRMSQEQLDSAVAARIRVNKGRKLLAPSNRTEAKVTFEAATPMETPSNKLKREPDDVDLYFHDYYKSDEWQMRNTRLKKDFDENEAWKYTGFQLATASF
ncbi:MAG: hypothetical protein ACSHX8_11140 [Opitutaceae bacterium]